VGSSERHYGWGEQNISSVLKVPRHCPFVLRVIVSFHPVLTKFNFFFGVGGRGGGLRAALDENFEITIGRAVCEAYRATWNLSTNSAFALGPRKTTKYLDRVGRSQDLPDANRLLASSPACRLLGYNNLVRTSQETHYVSATEPIRLMLCKI
jgi:hypothetical protein